MSHFALFAIFCEVSIRMQQSPFRFCVSLECADMLASPKRPREDGSAL
jgi:hypothetical protein